MSKIRIKSVEIENYRSFKDKQKFEFPDENYKKPVAIVGYNNSGKTNLMSCILYGLQINYVSQDTFSLDDFHNMDIQNKPSFLLHVDSSEELKFDKKKKANLSGYHQLNIRIDGDTIEGTELLSLHSLREGEPDKNFQAFGATKCFNIFYINFHKIKDEIATQKNSWGNLKSFLAKHIKKIVDTDTRMQEQKDKFTKNIKETTDEILKESKLNKFVEVISENYRQNLHKNHCKVEFGLPEYEDIFNQMLFKIGLNDDKNKLIPLDHFGDGFISMFVMAVIQAIAESNTEDQCLFLFEEPESFLHENHQEYFYKTVLCGLTKKGHQVIYTTHSDKMVDIFDTKGLIRLEMNNKNQTIKKYNNIEEDPLNGIEEHNTFIRTIEPNLNKILFSKKVILVEGPNDLMVYKHAIEKIVEDSISSNDEIQDKSKYAETYLNFHNIAIIPHHGKGTACSLAKLCEHLGLDYYLINDWDFKTNFIDKIHEPIEGLQEDTELWDTIRKEKSPERLEKTIKAMITTNQKIHNAAKKNQIHFNIPKLEEVIGYKANDKDSFKIWQHIDQQENFPTAQLLPNSLRVFLELNQPSN